MGRDFPRHEKKKAKKDAPKKTLIPQVTENTDVEVIRKRRKTEEGPEA